MRKRMNKRTSKRVFTRDALRVKTKNLQATPMRGGFRL